MVIRATDSATETFNGIPRSTIHELRTPLTAIRGYAQLLQRGVRTPEQAERAYSTIFRESERLAGMLDQLARVAEAALGAEHYEPMMLDLADVATAAVEAARQRWPEYRLGFRPVERVKVVADPRHLSDLLAVLLDNAAHYSEPGSSIELSISRDREQACLMVTDEGIGIPEQELERIFLCFQRASNASQAGPRAAKGLGIGLFLARAAAERAGGRLWAENLANRGSAFHLSLRSAS